MKKSTSVFAGSARARVLVGVAAAALTISVLPAQAAFAEDPPWMNTGLSPDERAALVLQEMTLEEKVELMTGDQGEAPSAFYNGPIDRLGIPELRMADATAGIASRGWTLPGTGDTATALPANQALAATWDPDRARDYAGVVARRGPPDGPRDAAGTRTRTRPATRSGVARRRRRARTPTSIPRSWCRSCRRCRSATSSPT